MNNKGQTLKETFSQALQSYKKKKYKNAEFLFYKIMSNNDLLILKYFFLH